MYSLRDKYAIAGVGWTDYSKNSGRTVRSLASEACLKAIGDAGLSVKDIDGFVSFNFNDSVPAISVATEIGVPAARYANDFLSGGNAANMIVLTAAAVIEAGLAENVVCYRAMNGRSGFRLGGGRDLSAYGITQFTAPFGWITYPQAMAMWCRRHMIEYGTQCRTARRDRRDLPQERDAQRTRDAARADEHGRLYELAHDRRSVSHVRHLP